MASQRVNAPSDEQLAEAVARRDQSPQHWNRAQEACAQLYVRHARKLLAFLAARVHCSDLEDVHQEVWERVWHYLPRGFRGGNFRAWLYQITRNYLIDLSRKRRVEPLHDEQELVDGRRHGPEELLIDQERLVILQQCMTHLGKEAAGLVQARLAGESYDQICRRLGLKPERAHRMFHRAKEQLQKCVQQAMA